MLANASNLRRAGLLLRAMAGKASWTSSVFVNAREIAKEKGVVATDKELADVESYLVNQGWLAADDEPGRDSGCYAITRHGLDECQRKLPNEAKVYRAGDRTD